MINEIINGVAVALSTAFGEGYKIHKNDISQGFDAPCFFIALLQPMNTPYPNKRKRHQNPFDIHFFPEDENYNGAMYETADRLNGVLQSILLLDGSSVRGTDVKWQIVDGVLHYFINYDVFALEPPEIVPEMEVLDVYAYPKNDSWGTGGNDSRSTGAQDTGGSDKDDDGDDIMGEIHH